MGTPRQQPPYDLLTERELDVVRLLRKGLTNREIAEELVLAPGTVNWYTKQIYAKLGVGNRTEAALRAGELGLLSQGRGEAPAPTGQRAVKNNLPAQVTSFVGRERPVAEVRHLLNEGRLVTLSGPGGVGKTRLALQVATSLLPRFQHGVWFVEFAPLGNPEHAPSTVAEIFGLHESGTEPIWSTLQRHLRDRQLLLLLDNLEHLPGAALFVAELLAAAPGLTVLATSREVLRVYGEQVYAVPPLELPPLDGKADLETVADCESVQLFLQRATSASNEFRLTDENAAVVAEVCARLDGLPLALELAAARTRLLTPQALVRQLTDRLQPLTSGPRDVHARQRTMRATIDWSYELLSQDEKRLYARLSVFQGGCTIEAVEAVCSRDLHLDVLNRLESLLDKSLLQQVEGPGGEPRFIMLETLHQYAREKLAQLGETEPVQKRHAEYFLSLANDAAPHLRGGCDQLRWLRRLQVEHENLRTALEWAVGGGDLQIGWRLAASLYWFWFRQGHHTEWQQWVTRCFEKNVAEAPPALRAELLTMYGALAKVVTGAHDGQAPLREAIRLFRELNDHWNTAWALVWLGYLCIARPAEYEEGLALVEEAIDLFRELADKPGLAHASNVVGELARARGDDARAKEAYEETLILAREMNDRLREALIYTNLGFLAMREQEYERAKTHFYSALMIGVEMGSRLWQICGLTGLSGAIGALGQPERAVQLMAAADAIRQSLGVTFQPADQIEFDGYYAALRRQLDREAFAAAWAKGQETPLEEALQLAFESAA